MQAQLEEKLPGFEDGHELLKASLIMMLLVVANVFAFVVSFGAGILITLPLTLFVGFMLLRDLFPKLRYPWSGWRERSP